MKRKHQHLPMNSSNIQVGGGGRGGSRLDSLEREELFFLTLLFKSSFGPSYSAFYSRQDLVTYRLNFEYENYYLHLVLFSLFANHKTSYSLSNSCSRHATPQQRTQQFQHLQKTVQNFDHQKGV